MVYYLGNDQVNGALADIVQDAGEYNGMYHVLSGEGEIITRDAQSTVIVPNTVDLNTAWGTQVAVTATQTLQMLAANLRHIKANNRDLTTLQMRALAYARVHMVAIGLAKTVTAGTHVNRLDIQTGADNQACFQITAPAQNAAQANQHAWTDDGDAFHTNTYREYNLRRILNREQKVFVRENMVTWIGVAHVVFKTRGHHYLSTQSMEYNKYISNLLTKSQINMDTFRTLFTERSVVRDLCHVIPPIHKLNVCLEASAKGYLPGTLAKRLTSYPAGCAVLGAMNSGYQSIKAIFPHVDEMFAQEVKYLEDLNAEIDPEDALTVMKGSVNAKYYGQQRVYINEQKMAQLASLILAADKVFQGDDGTLQKSKALERCATASPFIGQFFVKALKAYAQSERAQTSLLALNNQPHDEGDQ